MMTIAKNSFKILLICLLIVSCNQIQESPIKPAQKQASKYVTLQGPYFGQKLPGMKAEMFANDLLSVGMHEGKISFSPDGKEFLINVSTQRGQLLVEPKGVFGKGYTFHAQVKNGFWTEPKEFLNNSDHRISYPFYSPDGQRLFFNSRGPKSDTSYHPQIGIWYIEREGEGWGSTHEIAFGDAYQGRPGVYPSIASNGNLYFAVFPDRINGVLHVCKYENGQYSVPERLSEVINEVGGNHPYIAPDESYILYDSDLKDPVASTDIYISFRAENGDWKKPRKLGDGVNTGYDERRPHISFDGKYMFFASDRINPEMPDRPMTITQLQRSALVRANSQQHLYWVDAKVIDEMRMP